MKSIAIDGPAGAGKSTIARLVAKRLGYTYVDTGALYRSLACFCMENNIDINADDEALHCRFKDCDIRVRYIDGVQYVYLNGEDITGKIREEKVGNIASIIGKRIPVRKKLLDIQRDIAEREDVVMDGRDIGTVVLPEAELKIFLTASVECRADRRYRELINEGRKVDYEKIKQDIIIRDRQDTEREIAPLCKAGDGILVDSSSLSIDEVCDKIIDLYADRVKS